MFETKEFKLITYSKLKSKMVTKRPFIRHEELHGSLILVAYKPHEFIIYLHPSV
jgi:hypothetical protein